MNRTFVLFILLMAVWLFLSGHYGFWLIALGVLSSLFTVLLARRMDIVDSEGLPLNLIPGLLRYLPWLCGIVIRTNLDVAGRILHPRLPITPTVVRVPAEQQTAAGRATYANSITLTPGTISLDLTDDEIEVHVLSTDALDDLIDGKMARRVTAMENR